MPPTPSLLDWIAIKLGQPRTQRIVRFGLAALAAAWAAADFVLNGSRAVGAYGLLIAALALVVWGLSVRGAAVSTADLPALSLGSAGSGVRLRAPAFDRETYSRLMRGLRLPSALIIALAGQAALLGQSPNWKLGVALLFAGALLFVAIAWADGLISPPKAWLPAAEVTLNFRWALLAIAVVTGIYGFWAAGGNTFRLPGVLAWLVSVAAWMASLWDWQRSPREWAALARERWSTLARANSLSITFTRGALLFILVLLVGAYFRFAQLDSIPPEMTSDHVEKLFDVNDIMNGKRPVFFERNTGREPLQFYFAAFLVQVFKTGITHLTLKITGAVTGFLMLPFIYLLGRELEDRLFGLLAMLLAGMSFWATAISRVGLRFPLTSAFTAAALFFVLRGVRRSRRNDFLLAGLFLGIGLYGYSTTRLVPVALAAALAWFFLWPQSGASRRQLAANSVLMFATTFVVFLPLYRYAIS
ncbi:MAG: glycosyltransferase family 39 protein, partial [Anaerolineales bacterium]